MAHKFVLTLMFSLLFVSFLYGQSTEELFKSPPASAKPHTMWNWLNGNVSKEGITKDLETMKDIGIGGFQIFCGGFDVGTGFDLESGPVNFNKPIFFDHIGWAISESERLGLEVDLNNAGGWSCTGGPWVTPEMSMKVVIWSDTIVKGGKNVTVKLNVPEAVRNKATYYYEDIAVVAFPTPKNQEYKFEQWKDKSLHNIHIRSENFGHKSGIAPADAVISSKMIKVIKEKPDSEGNIKLTLPVGEWTIMRVGYTSTWSEVRPTPRSEYGLEIDKLSRKAVDLHWNSYLTKLISAAKGSKAFKALHIDSYEVGMQNWTEGFDAEFKKRRSYDLISYLPCMAGYIVDDVMTTERVLWDMRTTVAEMMHENFYEYFAEKCHENGLKLSIEPFGSGSLDAPSTALSADIPMTEFWQFELPRNLWNWTAQVVTGAAHLSGNRIAGAEALTELIGNFLTHPYVMKQVGDWAFSKGVNRYYFHTYTHQPWNDGIKPGMTFRNYGGNFHRNNTWFTKSHEWMKYIARCHYIMQNATFMADVLVLYGDEYGFVDFIGEGEPHDVHEVPGFCYDLGGMSSLNNLSVDENGDIRVTYNGKLLNTRYKYLLLKRAKLMLPESIAKLGELAEKGAKIYAPEPQGSPSLKNQPKADSQINDMIKRYWKSGLIGNPDEFEAALATTDPDCQMPDSVLFNHHVMGNDDYFFVSNQKKEFADIKLRFRVSGKLPEIWNPETGEIAPAENWSAAGKYTEVSLNMSPYGSTFVVFKKATDLKGKTTPKPEYEQIIDLNSDWTVTFDPEWGPKTPVTFNRLIPWNESNESDIKYFSGTAVYTKTFECKDVTPLKSMILDLGEVEIMARIKLNGSDLGRLWKPPYTVDVTSFIKQGTNNLEIEVTNLWVNRLIGDEIIYENESEIGIPPARAKGRIEKVPTDKPRRTFITYKHWNKDSKLVPSGLIGPVIINKKTN